MRQSVDPDLAGLRVGDLGLPEEASCRFDEAHVAKIAATLDAPQVPIGGRLPPLWHWAYFTPTADTADLGLDGHPVLRDGIVESFPRRMWGAGRLQWTGDFAVGDRVTRTSSVRSVKLTDGRSGRLLLVTLEHVFRRDVASQEVVLTEEQSLVYRSPGSSVPMPEDAEFEEIAHGDKRVFHEDFTPTPPVLFRFSALTFNSHRIHYDETYAREVEGYPTLVVHGPLTATRLAGFAEGVLKRQLVSFEFKLTAPLFVGCRARLLIEPSDNGADEGTANVIRNDGAVAVTATYRVRTR